MFESNLLPQYICSGYGRNSSLKHPYNTTGQHGDISKKTGYKLIVTAMII
jgi:hypothetical protein